MNATPDRLAAAVAQGHEDAVQVGPQEDCDCGGEKDMHYLSCPVWRALGVR